MMLKFSCLLHQNCRVLMQIQASEVYIRPYKSISKKWGSEVCILTNGSGRCLCSLKLGDHSLRREETSIYNWCCLSSSGFPTPAQMNADTPCCVTRVGWGEGRVLRMSFAAMKRGRNENSCVEKAIVHQLGLGRKPGQFLEL